ncbi:hypothetical protein ACIHFD_40550 [Nonomuraea sp. NPDC051941]
MRVRRLYGEEKIQQHGATPACPRRRPIPHQHRPADDASPA